MTTFSRSAVNKSEAVRQLMASGITAHAALRCELARQGLVVGNSTISAVRTEWYRLHSKQPQQPAPKTSTPAVSEEKEAASSHHPWQRVALLSREVGGLGRLRQIVDELTELKNNL